MTRNMQRTKMDEVTNLLCSTFSPIFVQGVYHVTNSVPEIVRRNKSVKNILQRHWLYRSEGVLLVIYTLSFKSEWTSSHNYQCQIILIQPPFFFYTKGHLLTVDIRLELFDEHHVEKKHRSQMTMGGKHATHMLLDFFIVLGLTDFLMTRKENKNINEAVTGS